MPTLIDPEEKLEENTVRQDPQAHPIAGSLRSRGALIAGRLQIPGINGRRDRNWSEPAASR
jgi:hypothetical protein